MNPFPSGLTREDVLSLGRTVPKKDQLVFLGRPTFSDNTKYLYLTALRRGLPAIWCSIHENLVLELKRNGLPALHLTRNEESFYTLLSASHVFHSVSPIEAMGGDQLLEAAIVHSRNIMLWHGISLKYLCLQRVENEGVFSPRMRFWLSSAGSNVALSTSACFDSYWVEVFNVRTLIRSGFPRNEVILREAFEHELIGASLTDQLVEKLSNGKPNVLIAPTWGGGNAGNESKSLMDAAFIEKFSELASTYQINIFLKRHHASHNQDQDLGLLLQGRGITLVPAGLDVYPWLKYFSLLMTDYSSIMFDFMLTGNPVVRLETQRSLAGMLEPALHFMPENLPTYDIEVAGDLDRLFSVEFVDSLKVDRERFIKRIFETSPIDASNQLIDKLGLMNKSPEPLVVL